MSFIYWVSSQDFTRNIFLTYFSTHNITLMCKLVETNRDKMFLFKNYLSIIAIIFLLEVFSCHQLENDLIRSSRSNFAIRMKLKRSKSRVLYYPNAMLYYKQAISNQILDLVSPHPSVQFVLRQFVVTKNNWYVNSILNRRMLDVQTLKTLKQTIPHYGHVATVFIQFYHFSITH